MPSAWIERRATGDGEARYLVRYRLGGRESSRRYGGSFRTMREARIRRDTLAGDLAALRVPEVRIAEPARPQTVAQAAARWQASRLDVAEGTRVLHRVALDRVLPVLGAVAVDRLSVDEVCDLVAALAERGYARGTIAKSVTALRMVLDHAGVEPNPARDRRVKLPREVREEVDPPTAEHVEAALRLVAPRYRLPLLVLEATGMRVGELEGLRWGDLDERQGRLRVRRSTSKSARPRFVPVENAELLEAIGALVPREDRAPEAPIFPSATQERMRTDVTRACKGAGVPRFTLHDLRHRWISLRLHERGGRAAGHARASMTLDVYAHVLVDDRPVDREALLV
jgi:integrase